MRSLSWILCGAPALITATNISLEPSVDSEAQSEPSDPSYRALVRYTVCEDGSNYPSKRRLPSNQKHDVFPPSNVLSFAPSSFLHPTPSFLSALHPLEGFSALESRERWRDEMRLHLWTVANGDKRAAAVEREKGEEQSV